MSIEASVAHSPEDLIGFSPQGIASRVLAKTPTGNVTVFAFDDGQGLSEHSAPFDALVLVLEGAMTLTIGGKPVEAPAQRLVRMPANVPHALTAHGRTRLMLIMLRDPA